MQSRSLMLSKCKVSLHTKAILEAELQLYSCSDALEITFSETLQLRDNRVRSNSTHRSELMVLSPRSALNLHLPWETSIGNQFCTQAFFSRCNAVSYTCCYFLADPDKFSISGWIFYFCVRFFFFKAADLTPSSSLW